MGISGEEPLKVVSRRAAKILLRLYRNKHKDFMEPQTTSERRLLNRMTEAGLMEQMDVFTYRISLIGIRKAREIAKRNPAYVRDAT